MGDLLYIQTAQKIADQVKGGTYQPGDRIPAVRQLSKQFKVSVSTVLQAYGLLEDQGIIEARPQSGYYVRDRLWQPPAEPEISTPATFPTVVNVGELAMEVLRITRRTDIIQLGTAIPDPKFLPTQAIHRIISSLARHQADQCSPYDFPPGNDELRRQIARRTLDAGCQLGADNIVITSGCQEALALCLRAVAQPGDIIAIESPTFYGLLQAIESLGMQVLEIPTHPRDGISLEALSLAIEQWNVKACVVVPSNSNPLGYCMSDDKKRQLVKLLAGHNIPLIEDDIYGELGFDLTRPVAAKSFDTNGNVLYCSSFSKTLSPGLRVGWVAAGRYQKKVAYLKFLSSIATATLPQIAIAEFLSSGGYDRYLRKVRGLYRQQTERMLQAVSQWFPQGTRVTQPAGGFVIWVELPAHVDSLQLLGKALEKNISFAPGQLFSAKQKYKNYIRLNCAQPWNETIDKAVMTLGHLVDQAG